jgi:hypothetical protein
MGMTSNKIIRQLIWVCWADNVAVHFSRQWSALSVLVLHCMRSGISTHGSPMIRSLSKQCDANTVGSTSVRRYLPFFQSGRSRVLMCLGIALCQLYQLAGRSRGYASTVGRLFWVEMLLSIKYREPIA